MNENKLTTKIMCDVCGFMVMPDGHAARCRVRGAAGWSRQRRAAWLGDTLHRLDVQLAVQMLFVEPERWEFEAQLYTSNSAMASYMTSFSDEYIGRSAHYVGTVFESNYRGDFRIAYLKANFPTVYLSVLASWDPPNLFGGAVAFRDRLTFAEFCIWLRLEGLWYLCNLLLRCSIVAALSGTACALFNR